DRAAARTAGRDAADVRERVRGAFAGAPAADEHPDALLQSGGGGRVGSGPVNRAALQALREPGDYDSGGGWGYPDPPAGARGNPGAGRNAGGRTGREDRGRAGRADLFERRSAAGERGRGATEAPRRDGGGGGELYGRIAGRTDHGSGGGVGVVRGRISGLPDSDET